MKEDRRRVILELFEAAAELPSQEWRAFLESSDPEVAQEVLELLERFEASQDSNSSLKPERIGRYVRLAPLGRGGMGEVYAARDTELDRTVALKFLSGDALQGSSVRRVLREAKAISALNHPNIVTVYEVVESGSELAIVMELVDGVALRQLSEEARPVPEVVRIGRQVAEALAAAHARGIIHRDIKPENVMIRRDGYVKLLDFGLARRIDSGQTSTVGVPAGTLRYMSPEQARGEKVTGATDIFSLGILLYELATGRHPFRADSGFETVHAIMTAQPLPPRDVQPSLPDPLSEMILAMLSKDPVARPSAQAVLEALNSESMVQPSVAPAAWPPRRRFNRTLPVVVLVIVGVALLTWQLATRRTAGEQRPLLRSVPVTSFPGSKDFACFSPDGSQIAFSWNGNDTSRLRDIYIKLIGAGEPLRLTQAAEDDILPSWSPDGHHIAFCRRTAAPDGCEIYLIPALGGTERKIADARIGVSWSPDGKTLALARGGIVLRSLVTGEERQITNAESHTDGLPVFSPDGKWIAFTRSLAPSAREAFVVPARGGAARQLTFDKRPTFGLTWTADSREIVFSSNRGESGDTLWRIRTEGGVPVPVTVGVRTAFYPAISRQGSRLVYTDAFVDVNIYRYEGLGFGSGLSPAPFGSPKVLIQTARKDISPTYSPDGEKIAFLSNRSGNDEIWVSSRMGGNVMQLTSFGGPPTGCPRWSPDGRWIAFDSRPTGSSEIFVVSPEGGAPRQLTFEPSDEKVPAWSPDGNWLYFISNRAGGQQVWKIPSAGGAAVQVTRTGAREAWASPDGKLVYFIKSAQGIWSVPVDGGPEKLVPGLELAHNARAWGVLAQGIYFVSADAPRYAIRFYSFRTGKITRLATLDKEPYTLAPVLSLSPDGRSLLYAQLDHDVNDIMLIEGFR